MLQSWSLMASETDSTLKVINLDRDKHDTASKIQIGRVADGMLYIAQLGYISQEVRPAILVRESRTQLIMYSLDTCVRYFTCLLIFKSEKGSMEALIFSSLNTS